MNRYVIEGVLRDLSAGRRVLVVGENLRESSVMLDQLVAAAEDAGSEFAELVVTRANGRQRIELPAGGWVKFISRRQGARGLSADVLFVDGDLQPGELSELIPAVMAGRGEVMRR